MPGQILINYWIDNSEKSEMSEKTETSETQEKL